MSSQLEHPLLRRLRVAIHRFKETLLRHEQRILTSAIVIFSGAVSIIGAWKLWAFAYNALDLAIYNQVAWNSVHGRWFQFSIHPHSYLGDHFEIALAALFPIYAAFQHPLTLIILQAIAIAMAVIPLTKIAAKFVGRPWHLLFGFAYLANPTIQNMALYEFHLLPFAIPLISWALLAYIEKSYTKFLIFSTLALTIREDISFVIIGFALLALLDRRKWKWWIIPTLLGVAWLLGSLTIASLLNDYGSYKFLIYYSWLGNSLPKIALGIISKPFLVLQHLLSFQNLGFLAGLLLPLAFMPIFRLRWIIPAGLTLLQLMLAVSSGELLIEIHYPAVIIPFLITAAAASFQFILTPPRSGILRAIGKERGMATIIFIVVITYGMFVIGPFAKAVSTIARTPQIIERVSLERSLTKENSSRPLAAGFETLTELSRQERLFSLHYVLLGKKQFSEIPYILPSDVDTIFFDQRDALIYQLLYENQDQNHYGGYQRIRDLLAQRGFHPTTFIDRFVIFKRGPLTNEWLYRSGHTLARQGTSSAHDEITYLGWASPSSTLQTKKIERDGKTFTVLPLELTFVKTKESDDILQLEFQFRDAKRVVAHSIIPLGGGLYPTSDWKLSEIVTSNIRPIIPKKLSGQTLSAHVRVMRLRGDVVLNGARSLVLRYSSYQQVGQTIDLGQFTFEK